MNLLSSTNYKDELPKNTINRIKNILHELNITPLETSWKNSAHNFYSLSLFIKDTNLSTNGKGITPEYALASAYGELMERLQNQSFFRLSIDLSPEAFQYEGFYYAPDEKYINMKDFIKSKEDWSYIQKNNMTTSIDIEPLLKKWMSLSSEDIPCDFITLPYINLTNNKLSYIPIKMISKMYMSNGMCAGNTIEEALIEGTCEILERFVNKQILLNKIIPPTIPCNYLEKFPKVNDMLHQIESKGNYKVIVKDCSLGKGYPVVGVIFINKVTQNYFIKFGSHPVFEIALERTLTELLQGQDIKNLIGTTEFSYDNKIENKYNNLIGILVNGSGIYPKEIFSSNFSYSFKEFDNLTNSSNKSILKFLVNLLSKQGYHIFLRDVSYLGFTSFHIIIPGLSEIDNFDDISSLDEYIDYVKIKNIIRNTQNVSNSKIKKLLKYIDTQNIHGPASVMQLLNLTTKNSIPWYYLNIDLFKFAAYYKIGDFQNAYETFDKFLKPIQPNNFNREVYVYYKCVRDYIGTLRDNLKENESIEILRVFYSSNMINQVISQFKNKDEIFNYFGQFRCWDCKHCEFKTSCSYISTENIYKILKHKYAMNNIDQNNLKNLNIGL